MLQQINNMTPFGMVIFAICFIIKMIIDSKKETRRDEEQTKNQKELQKVIVSSNKELKAMVVLETQQLIKLKVIEDRYSENSNSEQCKALVTVCFHNTKKSIINELKIIKVRNGIKVRKEKIEENIKSFLGSRYLRDFGYLTIFKYKGIELSSYMREAWITTIYDLCIDYVFCEMADDLFISSLTRDYESFIQEVHTEISHRENLKSTQTQSIGATKI